MLLNIISNANKDETKSKRRPLYLENFKIAPSQKFCLCFSFFPYENSNWNVLEDSRPIRGLCICTQSTDETNVQSSVQYMCAHSCPPRVGQKKQKCKYLFRKYLMWCSITQGLLEHFYFFSKMGSKGLSRGVNP